MRLPSLKIASFSIAIAICVPSEAVSQTCSDDLSLSQLQILSQAVSDTDSKTAPPLHPAIKEFTSKIVKSFACQSVINYYARQIGLPNDIVTTERIEGVQSANDAIDIQFTNKIYKGVCGIIRNNNIEFDVELFKIMVKAARVEAITRLPDLGDQSDTMITPFLPYGVKLPVPSTENLEGLQRSYQSTLVRRFKEAVEQQRTAVAEPEHSRRSGWCASVLPTASGPDEVALKDYGAVYDDYKKFKALLDEALLNKP